jgi:hypothetical protein
MQNQIMTPESETFLANISANQSKTKLREADLLARANVGTCGKWRKLPHALASMALALLLLAGSAFAPPGFWASLGAALAMGSFIIALYYALAFDHGQLKQTALFFAQAEDKVAAKASAEESQNLAAVQIGHMETAANQQANERLLSGDSLEAVKQYYAGALETVRADRQVFQTLSAAASKAIDAADREVRDATARFEDRARRWWPSRLVPAYTRAAASQWLSALGKRAAARFDQTACSAATEAYEHLAAFLARLAGECASAQTETAAAALDALAKIDSAKGLQNVTGCNKRLPLASDIAQAVEDQVKSDASSIRHAVASRPADQSLTEAIQQQALRVAATVQLPKTFGQFFGGLNGAKQLLLKQIDLQSSEFAIANPYAGRQRIRHRFLLVEGGETSPVSKEVKAISKDMIVRSADHPRPDEFICVTEERFSPIGESDELLEGFRQFRNLAPEKRGSMIVALQDDPDFLVTYSPESAHDPSRPAHLLFVALVLGLIQRTGAECYKIVDQNDPEAPSFAKGVDQAVETLAADEVLARRIEQAIENLYSVEGADAIRKKLLDAKAKNPVPSAATKRFRETLSQEMRRLDSPRPALAA